ncbi:MAG: helix-turn-helix domain-containing protein [Desulfotomaculales bacterium]
MYTHPTALRCRRQAMQLDARKTVSRREIARQCMISHTTFYKYLHRYQDEGDEGLYDRQPGPRIRPNQTPPDVEEAVLEVAQEYPAYGPRRISATLHRQGVDIGETAVYEVLRRHGLNTRQKRLAWLESLNPPAQKTAWDVDRENSQRRHVHAPYPGYLMSQDGKLVCRLAGVGKVYVQVGVDCASSFGWAKLYGDKTADSATDLLKHACREYAALGARLKRVLTDNGREYGSAEPTFDHYYGTTCLILGVKHKTTNVKHPWRKNSNGWRQRPAASWAISRGIYLPPAASGCAPGW